MKWLHKTAGFKIETNLFQVSILRKNFLEPVIADKNVPITYKSGCKYLYFYNNSHVTIFFYNAKIDNKAIIVMLYLFLYTYKNRKNLTSVIPPLKSDGAGPEPGVCLLKKFNKQLSHENNHYKNSCRSPRDFFPRCERQCNNYRCFKSKSDQRYINR